MNDKVVHQIYHTAGLYSTRESDPLARILMVLDKDFAPFSHRHKTKKKSPEREEPQSLKSKMENHKENMVHKEYTAKHPADDREDVQMSKQSTPTETPRQLSLLER